MKFKRLLEHADRFFGVLIAHVIISQLNYYIMVEYLSASLIDPTVADEMAGTLPLVLLSALVSLLSLYSITRITAIYDRLYLPETLERERKCANLKERILCLMKEKLFWGEMVCYAAIYLILPLEWLQYAFAKLLMRSEGFAAKLIALAILLPVFLFITIFARLSAMKYLRRHPGEIDPNNPKKAKQESTALSIRMALAYLLGPSALMMLIVLAISFAPIIRELLPAIVTVVVALFILPPTVRMIRALRKRRAFVKELNAICTEKGYDLPAVALPYRSLLTPFDGECFSVTVGGVRYSCKLIAALRRNDPLALFAHGECQFIHNVRMFRMNIRTRIKAYRFGYDAEEGAKKILIINPIPKRVYVSQSGRSVPIDNGDMVGEYKIYSASAFLNALERDCLDR